MSLVIVMWNLHPLLKMKFNKNLSDKSKDVLRISSKRENLVPEFYFFNSARCNGTFTPFKITVLLVSSKWQQHILQLYHQ